MTRRPRFSVVVPTCGRPAGLRRCLEALARLDYPRDLYEVIVVADGEQQGLEGVVGRFSPPLQLSLLAQRRAGPAAARNHGATRARGEYLAFTDDDCEPAPDWLEVLARHLEQHPKSAVVGRARNGAGSEFAAAGQLIVDYLHSSLNEDAEDARFFTANNVVLPRGLFEELCGFDRSFRLAAGEDRELAERWRRRGHRLVFAPEATVVHRHEMGLVGFVRQQLHYGMGAHQLRQRRPRHDDGGSALSRIAFYARLLRFPFEVGSGWGALRTASIFLLAQACVASGFAWSWSRASAHRSSSPSRADRSAVR